MQKPGKEKETIANVGTWVSKGKREGTEYRNLIREMRNRDRGKYKRGGVIIQQEGCLKFHKESCY